jgi:hypothetical protein
MKKMTFDTLTSLPCLLAPKSPVTWSLPCLVAKNIRTCANYDISIHCMDAAREGQGDLLI